MANTSVTGNGTGAYTGGIPLNVTLHAWPIPKLDTNLKPINETNPVIIKSIESAKNYTNSLHNLNATGYVAIDDDLTDTGFTDVQTFILAGIATVIPLLVIVAAILGVRFLWRKYRARKGEGYEGVLQKEESTEPLGKLHGYSLPHELKTSESQFTVTPGEDLTTPSPQVLTPKSNGSVITMTLRNNHLIVETEETENTPTGMKIESKGTTTKFVTSTVPDFRVDLTPEKMTNYNKEVPHLRPLNGVGSSEDNLSSRNHGALVHCPPEEMEDELDKGSSNTGLSQSDLSVSSGESQNPSYRYGNQRGYESGGYGYPEYSGYAFAPKQSNEMGPIQHKTYLRSSSVMETTDSCLSENEKARGPMLKDILMSDIQAREKRVEEDEKRFQEEQRLLGNGDTLVKGETKTSLEKDVCLNHQQPGELSVTQLKSEISQLAQNEHLTNNAVTKDVADVSDKS